MLYGHIETMEERVDHLLRLRELQDETGGFQTFICFPFLPKHTELGKEVKQTSMWDDLRTMAISRLMLDNFKNIKAYWVMLTVPVAQVALSFGANDIDGTVHKETILHDAGAQSPTAPTAFSPCFASMIVSTMLPVVVSRFCSATGTAIIAICLRK